MQKKFEGATPPQESIDKFKLNPEKFQGAHNIREYMTRKIGDKIYGVSLVEHQNWPLAKQAKEQQLTKEEYSIGNSNFFIIDSIDLKSGKSSAQEFNIMNGIGPGFFKKDADGIVFTQYYGSGKRQDYQFVPEKMNFNKIGEEYYLDDDDDNDDDK